MKKLQVMVLIMAMVGILSIPIVSFLIPMIYGESYLTSIPVFIILFLAMLVFLIAVPIHMAVFYYFGYPKLFFFTGISHFIIISVVGWNLISLFGPQGAATTVLIGQVFNFVVPLIWIVRRIDKKR